jgi:DMSO reductase anchor subunit
MLSSMDLFPRCFLLVFGQLAVGGFLALSIPPFHEIERGFFKSSGGVYLFVGLMAAAGRTALLLRARTPATAVDWFELGLWWAFVGAGTTYLASLWGERMVLRARAFVATWATGALALIVSAERYRLAALASVETLLYPLSFLISALLLGAVTTGMLLGHWYLIDRNLSLAPFRRMLRFFVTMLVLQAAILVFGGGLLAVAGNAATVSHLVALFHDHAALLGVRVVLGPLASAVLAWMIWQTLKVPQTMAATGLFYIAILSVLVGEFMGRFILFRTSLPL